MGVFQARLFWLKADFCSVIFLGDKDENKKVEDRKLPRDCR